MRRVGPFSVEGATAIVCAGMLLLGVTTCNARRDGARQERVRQAEAIGYRAAKASLARRHTTDSVVALSSRQAAIVKQQLAANRKVEARLSATLAANDSLLSLPPDSGDVGILRYHLARTTEVARVFRDSTEVVLAGVAVLISAHEAERQAWLAERAANAAESIAKDSLIAALRESGQACRILFMACPSRVQSVGIGALGTLLLLLL